VTKIPWYIQSHSYRRQIRIAGRFPRWIETGSAPPRDMSAEWSYRLSQPVRHGESSGAAASEEANRRKNMRWSGTIYMAGNCSCWIFDQSAHQPPNSTIMTDAREDSKSGNSTSDNSKSGNPGNGNLGSGNPEGDNGSGDDSGSDQSESDHSGGDWSPGGRPLETVTSEEWRRLRAPFAVRAYDCVSRAEIPTPEGDRREAVVDLVLRAVPIRGRLDTVLGPGRYAYHMRLSSEPRTVRCDLRIGGASRSGIGRAGSLRSAQQIALARAAKGFGIGQSGRAAGPIVAEVNNRYSIPSETARRVERREGPEDWAPEDPGT